MPLRAQTTARNLLLSFISIRIKHMQTSHTRICNSNIACATYIFYCTHAFANHICSHSYACALCTPHLCSHLLVHISTNMHLPITYAFIHMHVLSALLIYVHTCPCTYLQTCTMCASANLLSVPCAKNSNTLINRRTTNHTLTFLKLIKIKLMLHLSTTAHL